MKKMWKKGFYENLKKNNRMSSASLVRGRPKSGEKILLFEKFFQKKWNRDFSVKKPTWFTCKKNILSPKQSYISTDNMNLKNKFYTEV